ncbi:hypothetical protein ACFTSF_04540 [Kribbella sp. NPDC056951]|uniref:hypothetical protein n=1 Tax=Kribbella sp. NPDC056951 TaxID=3345978 RepID=UPI003631E535
MTNKQSTGTPTPCQPWCKKPTLCGGPICCPQVHKVPQHKAPARPRRPKKWYSTSGW